MRSIAPLGVAGVMVLATLAYASYPLAAVLVAPLCRVFETPIRSGQMWVTRSGTVMCSTSAAMEKVSHAKSMIDVPPFILVTSGCYPAANVLVRVVELRGDLAGIQLPRAMDQSREWWITQEVTTSSQH